MNENQFNAMLAIIVPPIMYQDELLTGSYDYPEEA